MRKIKEETIYNFERTGSFGKFFSGNSFPIEFLMTSFVIDELDDLTFARDVRPPGKIDFDLLIQRDIDEERVRNEIAPYLNPSVTTAELKSRAVFFPPILAAIIPTQEKKMRNFYTDEISKIDTVNKLVSREWPGLLKLTFFKSDSAHAYQIEVDTDEGRKDVGVDLAPTQLELRLVKGNQLGAKLVIIDGQHRVFALKQILSCKPELLENLVLPVCILLSPNSTEKMEVAYLPVQVPTVPEVFRHLFVDVNKTMELVGGHFNILLSDESIGSLACRRFCDEVLKSDILGEEGLAVVEWNTKKHKDSTIIKRDYSLTSIGVIDQAMAETIGRNKHLTKYLLYFADVEDELYPDDDDIKHPDVEWDKFSLTQKKAIDKQVREYLVPCLIMIFFKTEEFATAFNIFKAEVEQLRNDCKEDTQDAIECRCALDQIMNYIPINDGSSFDAARMIYKRFENEVRSRRESEVAGIIKYAIFQRAIFRAFEVLLSRGRDFNIKPLDATRGLVKLLNISLAEKGTFFHPLVKRYMQFAVFNTMNIKPTEETRKALSYLILAHLGNKANSLSVAKEMGLSGTELKDLVDKMQDDGLTAASDFIKVYEKARKKAFKGSYRVDYSLDRDDRDELMRAEEEQKLHLKEVREGTRKKGDVSEAFDTLVDKFVKVDVDLATKELRDSLNYKSDIVGYESDSTSE